MDCFCYSVAQLCPNLCNLMDCSTPGFQVLHHVLKLSQALVHRVSDAIQPPHPLSSPSPSSSIFPSIKVFSNELTLHIRWPKYWNFSFSRSPSSEISGLISFMIDCFNLLAVQATLKSFLNSIFQKHQFISIQPSLRFNSHIHTWLLEKP